MLLEGIRTLDDFDFEGETTIVRVDINTPIDPRTYEPLDDRRFKAHRPTLTELAEKRARLVLLAHQGRPGEADFTTLERHARLLAETIDREVKYVDSIFSSYAIREIKQLRDGEILLLENVRFYSEENLNRPPDVQARTLLVQRLSRVADIYVGDAFAAAHRSQPSIVGFPVLLPCCAGRLMQRELETLERIMGNPKRPLAYVLGGTKADDAIEAARKALENNADYVLVGGVTANVFLAAKGYELGKPSMDLIRGKGMEPQIKVAKELLQRYEEKIVLPRDVALDAKGERLEVKIAELPKNFLISDIGSETVELFKGILQECETIFVKGALGIFEERPFAFGTEQIIKAVAASKAFSVIGGGHLVAAAKRLGLEERIDHISSGGGAFISLLAGTKLPGVEALRKY